MTTSTTSPGVYFTVAPRPMEASPLRSDVAGFLGRTRRGPVGQPVRVEQWQGYLREFGGLRTDSSTPYAIHGYFENGGEVAYVVRLCGRNAKAASATWRVGELDHLGQWTAASPAAFSHERYRIEATSPGQWANGTRVTIRYRLQGASGGPELDIAVQVPGEPPEYLAGLALYPPDQKAEEWAFERQIAARTFLIRLIPDGPPSRSSLLNPGPHYDEWELTLEDGTEGEELTTQEYLNAARKLGEEDTVESTNAPSLEVALVAVPGLYEDLTDSEAHEEVLSALIAQAEQLHDRLVIVDIPTDPKNSHTSIEEPGKVIEWLTKMRGQGDGKMMRAAVVYHPRLWVPDPLGGIARPLRSVPPSGHVAGSISWVDRQRGAHHTPANASLFDAVDVTGTFEKNEQARFNDEGINLIRCFPGRGLLVWGGRTLTREPEGRFIAHRRLIHRLVRAIRRVAEPLVFDINGPELWLTIVRAVTTVLLEAWRAGALKGDRPDEAFRVQCDEKTTPQDVQELGQVFCEIAIAPAVPMEFIFLRVGLNTDGVLEVFES